MPAKVDVPTPANDTRQAGAPDIKPGKEAAPASSATPEVAPAPTPAVKDDAKKPAGPELDRTSEAEPKASPQPVRIEGLPITKGTIGPAADEPAPSPEADQTIVTEAPQPLRPEPAPQKAPVTPETVIEDIEEPSREPAERADAPPGAEQSGSSRLPSEPAQSDQSAKPSEPGNDASTPAEET